jgi:hypothetical protein
MEAARLEAVRRARQHERNMRLLGQYSDIAAVAVGTGILAAIIIAIATHLTPATWAYANTLDKQGYPPLWVWAGGAGAALAAGMMYSRRK